MSWLLDWVRVTATGIASAAAPESANREPPSTGDGAASPSPEGSPADAPHAPAKTASKSGETLHIQFADEQWPRHASPHGSPRDATTGTAVEMGKSPPAVGSGEHANLPGSVGKYLLAPTLAHI